MSRSTFSILFYANKSKLKNGIVPIMGRVTINGTQSQFSCKQSIPLDLWDVKGNRAKGRSREALQLNRDLDNIKAQLIKHYQHLSDKEGFVTAEMVRNAYQGLGSEYETLLNAFDKDIASFKKRVGKDRVISTLWAMQRSRKNVAEFIQLHYRRSDMSMLEISEFDYYTENTQIIMNKPYCYLERTKPNSSFFLGIFVNLQENIGFLAINLLYLYTKRL